MSKPHGAERPSPVPRPPRVRRRAVYVSVPPPRPDLPVVTETSAGGIIVDTKVGYPRAAIIARRNRAGRLEWCLPKGHLENDETHQEAAIREIAEETGISGEIVAPLGVIEYWFSGEDRRIHKSVHHFLLTATGGELTIENDPDGEAEDVAWVPLTALPDRLAYPNERRLVALARKMLPGET